MKSKNRNEQKAKMPCDDHERVLDMSLGCYGETPMKFLERLSRKPRKYDSETLHEIQRKLIKD